MLHVVLRKDGLVYVTIKIDVDEIFLCYFSELSQIGL
jgi:hypothetical protein